MPKSNKPFSKWWHKFLKIVLKCNPEQKNPKSTNPLEHINLDELALEDIAKTKSETPDLEIAFRNPETGEVEILSLPQDIFKVKMDDNNREETVVVLELDKAKVRKDVDEDPYSRITHFPPSSRLH